MNTTNRYLHQTVEQKWRDHWAKANLDTADITHAKRPFYNLMMFPYPSAEGLHVGNMYAFTGSDIFGRFKRMQGYNVFEPIGLDGFGIHSENYALKIGRHPMDHAEVTEKNYYDQLHKIGAMYDWSRTVETYDPEYYRWTQWLFVQMFKHGLAYRGKAEVNWCPGCKTVLADEQVLPASAKASAGTCERCGNAVKKRELEQWFFKITAYAEKLLVNSYALDWSEKVKLAQQAWIGKKEGINISYPVVTEDGTKVSELTCFTTRPDTNFGATFVVMAPEQPLVDELFGRKKAGKDIKRALTQINTVTLKQIHDYIDASDRKTTQERVSEGRKKTGVFTGFYCVNGLNNEKLPLYISDFVLADFGSGAVVGVPGHDKRDFEFAIQFDIDIKRVVVAPDDDSSPILRAEQVQEDEGIMVSSGFLDGMDIHTAKEKMMDYLEQKGWGKRVTTYHLRDWLISRQRYWGPPIPMIHCSSCGWQPVPEKDLPVILPRIEDYKPGDDGIAPLAKHKEFYETKCPSCGGKAVRETDVSDTFLDSSWYFLRYPSVNSPQPILNPSSPPLILRGGRVGLHSGGQGELPWDPSVTKKWLPVHLYTGGAEHSVLHLMYSRFVWMALRDWGYLDFSGEAGSRPAGEEPFSSFYAHGLVIKDGAKMSKSKGNVVNPDEYIARYGADALRLYLMFTGPYDQGGDFRDSAMEGMSRWVQRVWRLVIKIIDKSDQSDQLQHSHESSATVKKALQRAIKKVGEDIQRRRYNTAIAAMMELVNTVVDEGGLAKPGLAPRESLSLEDLKDFLKILAPFAPYMTEELYQMINTSQDTFTKANSIHFQPWPAFDEKFLVEDTVEIAVQVNGKFRDSIRLKTQDVRRKSDVEAAAHISQKVAKYLEGKTVKKVIFVPGRIINFVA